MLSSFIWIQNKHVFLPVIIVSNAARFLVAGKEGLKLKKKKKEKGGNSCLDNQVSGIIMLVFLLLKLSSCFIFVKHGKLPELIHRMIL